ncbi:inorganic phosphate transporter, partial [Pseudomonas sp. MWU13-2625]
MATPSLTAASSNLDSKPQLDKKPGPFTLVAFFAVLAMGLLFTAYSLVHDMHELGTTVTTWTPFLLLGVALLIALGFEFVNGFHDTANAVAIALGLGTMVGWKRIVVTVGEKIGKTHLTYAQGASAETVAMLTIGAADMFGLPVSTTHVLSSGVAGTMVANG